jgi:hyperosmotically inducible periplasmic protein
MDRARLRTWAAAMACSALFVGTACNRNEPAETSTVPSAQTPAQSPGYDTDEARTDSGITTAVQAKYYENDTIRSNNVDVTTTQGVVTLRGNVDSAATKQQAEQLAQSVQGVTRVENQLQIGADRPTATTGATADTRPATSGEGASARVDAAWLTTKIQAQYFTNAGLKPWNVDVTSTSDGVVTLRGEVDNATEKQQAVAIARGTEGVSRVDDHLRVRTATTAGAEDASRPTVTQPDGWITAKIQAKYFMDGDVKGRDVDVDTVNGVVTLKGAVKSEAERRQAEALARSTDGVREVQNQLTMEPIAEPVAPLPDSRPTADNAGAKIEDAFLTTKIQSQFFLDSDVKGHDIDVDTRNGIVTLKGSVETEAQKKEAEQIAVGTEGVSKVVNQLTIGQKR